MEYKEILERVKQVVLESCIYLEEDEVVPEARIQADLGFESIDFLDIIFRLEREFRIKIPRNELFPESIFQGDPDYVVRDTITSKGIKLLQEKMPFANLEKLVKDPQIDNISDLFTVEMIAKYVHGKLQNQ